MLHPCQKQSTDEDNREHSRDIRTTPSCLRAVPKHGGRLLPPGEQLPSLDRLAAEYGVSRATAQRAVKVLTEAGLVEAPGQWGVFVAERT